MLFCFTIMTTNKRGFIALVASLIISTLLMAAVLSSSEPVAQYRQGVDGKLKEVMRWERVQEAQDADLFHSFKYSL